MGLFKRTSIENHYKKNITQQKLIFRSGWEFSFASFLDSNTNVKTWSNDFPIKYKDKFNHPPKIRTYRIDFRVQMTNGAILLCEVKPIKSLQTRVSTNSIRYKRIHTSNLLKNYSKFETTEVFCRKIGWKFFLVNKKEHHFEFYRWDVKDKKPILIR